MGCYPIGAECCNNCRQWACHSERKIQGNPPKEVYTTSNCDKCTRTNRSTLSKDTCAMFSHIGGVSRTFPLGQSPTMSASTSQTGNPASEYDPGMVFMNAILEDIATRRAERAAVVASRVEKEEEWTEADEKFARWGESQKLANERVKELLEEGLSPDCVFRSKAIEFMQLLDRAKGGEANAQFLLAKAFWNGKCGAKQEDESSDCGKGWRWCDKAADNGYCWAQLHKAYSWLDDALKSDSEDDFLKSIKWFERALEHSEIQELDKEKDCKITLALNCARLSLAALYVNGEKVDPNFDAAMKLYDAVIDTGETKGQEYKKAVEELCEKMSNHLVNLREWAESGLSEAWNDLGMIYAGYPKFKRYGLVIKIDERAAVEYFQKAAEGFSLDAMVNLGNCYEDGEGVEKDAVKAAEWYKKSAECGGPSGEYHYGMCLRKGIGVEKDERGGLRWLMKAGAQGHGRALNVLGSCAKFGLGMKEDPDLAFEWYQRAADAGDVESMYDLGCLYHKGYGCIESKTLGDEWQKKAEQNGYSGGW